MKEYSFSSIDSGLAAKCHELNEKNVPNVGSRALEGLTNFSSTATVTLSSGSDARRSVYGFEVSSGSYNASSSVTTSLSTPINDFGETFAAATFAPTKFNEP